MQTPGTATNGSRHGAGNAPPPTADAPPDGRSKVRSLHIAVADNDPAICQSHQEILARLGHEVCVAHSGRQLVEQCRLLRPDLVLAEVKLPDLDGITAAEEVCRGQPTPIILLPGNDDAAALRRALANQYVLACLFKPLKEADLRAAIAVTMGRFEQFQSLRQEAADLRQALEDRKLIERAKGMVMRYTGVQEEDAYRRLRKLASNQNRKLAEVAQNVLAAGEVFHQLEQSGELKKSNDDGPIRYSRMSRPHRNSPRPFLPNGRPARRVDRPCEGQVPGGVASPGRPRPAWQTALVRRFWSFPLPRNILEADQRQVFPAQALHRAVWSLPLAELPGKPVYFLDEQGIVSRGSACACWTARERACPERIADEVSRVLRRTEESRIYHWVIATGKFPPRRGQPDG